MNKIIDVEYSSTVGYELIDIIENMDTTRALSYDFIYYLFDGIFLLDLKGAISNQ